MRRVCPNIAKMLLLGQLCRYFKLSDFQVSGVLVSDSGAGSAPSNIYVNFFSTINRPGSETRGDLVTLHPNTCYAFVQNEESETSLNFGLAYRRRKGAPITI